MKQAILLALSGLLFFTSRAQDFSNKGKDFWVGYGSHVTMYNSSTGADPAGGGSQEMVLYFTADVTANVTITTSSGWTRNYVVPANTVVESVAIPKSGTDDVRLRTEGKSKKSIHITSDKPVVAYAHIYNGAVSGATLLFPTNTLGKEYYSLNYTQTSNQGYSYPYCFVIATEDSTIIEVTPTANTLTHTAGISFRDTLRQGEVLNLLGQITGNNGVDLTGTKIKSVASSTGQCKKIAVFSGSGKINIRCNNSGGSSADNYIQQVFPATAWGQKYFTVPTANMPFNYFRVLVKDPTTVVKYNGVVQGGLVNNFYYNIPLSSSPGLIEADKPVLVAQYITTASTCGNNFIGGNGDPEMIYLSSIEQTIDKITLNSTYHSAITQHWINVLIKTSAASSFRLDGNIPSSSFIPHPYDPVYSYAQISVVAGQHSLKADSGFNAIAYGYGSAESYGYNAGTNIRDLFNFITPINPLNISNQTTACAGTPFYFSITYPFQPTSLYWDFHGFQNPNVTNSSPDFDTTYFVNGKQVWRYRITNSYIYNSAGNYPVSITAGTTGSDGCGNLQTRDDTLFVFNPPVTNFYWQHNGCVSDSVSFRDTTNYTPGTYSYKWYWNFGDGSIDSVHYPKHKYLTAGTYQVKFALISNVGCRSDTSTYPVTVTDKPVAKFGISSPYCEGASLTFTDSSQAFAPGTLGKWYWDYGDGIRDTLNNNSNRIHSYTPWGNKTPTLKVETNSGCKSDLFSKPIFIGPKPVVNFGLPPGICLPADSAHFFDSSTIADASQSSFGYLWNFGDPPSSPNNTSGLKNPAHYYNNPGPFNIKLIVTSGAGCSDSTTKTLSNVYPQAHADFNVNAENCLNDTTYFTSTSNGNGSTVTNWFWDFGDGTPVSTLQNPSHTYGTSSTYTVKHWIKTDKGCTSDTMQKPLLINPLPAAKFGFSAPDCVSASVTFSDSSVANAGNIVLWKWNMGDGSPIQNNTTNVPFNYTYAATGTYTVTLSVETNKGCKSVVFSKQIIINPAPVPGFGMTSACLPYGITSFSDSSTIADGTQSQFTYLWNFGDPASGALNTSTLQNPQHSYSSVGPFNVTLTVTSNKGCTKSITNTYNTIYPQAHADFNVNAETCLNDTTYFTSTSNGNGSIITNWFWDFGDGTPLSTLQNPSHTYGTSASYTVKHWIKTDKGCVSDTMQKPLLINPLPAAKFGFTAPDCVSTGITFSDSSVANAGNIVLWKWNMGDGSPVQNLTTNVPFNYTYAATGAYTVTLSVETNKGCKSVVFSKQIIINPVPVPVFGMSAVCLPYGIANFSDSSTIADGTQSQFTYLWNFGDPASGALNISTLQNPQHYYSSVGPFNVTLTVTSNNGCTRSITKIYNTIYSQAHGDFTVAPENCLNDPTTFSDQSNGNGSTIAEWHWNFGDGQTSLSQNPAHTFGASGTYTIKHWIVTDKGCVSDTMQRTVTINPLPTANFNFSAPSCETKVITFTDASVPNVGTLNLWNWDFGDPSSGAQNASALPNPTHVFSTAGTYSVSLYVKNTKGCQSIVLQKQVIINPQPQPGFISPSVCLSDAFAQFIDTSKIASGSITNWSWNFGDPTSGAQNTSALRNPQHRYNAIGNYTVTLITTSNNNCVATLQQTFTVNGDIPIANFTPLNAGGLCANDSVAIQNASTVNFGNVTRVDIYWDNTGSPAVFQTDNSPSPAKIYKHLYPNFQTPLTKTFTIRYRAYSGATCINDKIKTITVNAAPKVLFTAIPNTCLYTAPFQITQASETGGVPGSFQFTGPGISPTGLFNTATAGVGTHTIRYTFTSNAGCIDTASQQIKVLDPPVPNFGYSSPVCETQAITFTDSSTSTAGNIVLWKWNMGDGSPLQTRSTNAPFNYIYAAAGTYTVTLSVETNQGCKSVVYPKQIIIKPLPVPGFGMSAACLPYGITSFSDSSTIPDGSQSQFTFSWNFGDPTSGALNTSTLQNPQHSYSSVGPFNVMLTVTSNNGCTKSITKTYNTIYPQAHADFNVNAETCLNDTTYFTSTSNGNGSTVLNWFWDFGDGFPVSTLRNPSHKFATAITYSVKHWITTDKGCVSDTMPKPVLINPLPVANYGFSSPACETKAVTFSDSSVANAGSITKWSWDYNDGSPVDDRTSGASFTHIFATANTYNVKLTVTTDKQCKSTQIIKSIKINPAPFVNFSRPVVCLPNANASFFDQSSISDGTANLFTYLWDFGDPSSGTSNTSTQKNPSHVYSALGPYNITLSVTSNNSCTKDTTISYNGIHPLPQALFKPDPAEVCVNSNILFSDLSSGTDTTLKTWMWTFGDGGSSSLQNPAPYIYTTPGNYSVRLTVTNNYNCVSTAFSLPVKVDSIPIVNAGLDRNVLEGGTIILEPIITGSNLQYLWSPPDFLSSTVIRNPVVTGVDDRLYTLTVKATGGCSASDKVFVKVLKFPKIPNTFTPNNDGINDTWIILYLETYPGNRVQVFSRYGQLVFESKGYPKPWDGKMNGKVLPFGTYYYILEPGSGRKPITGYITLLK